MRSRLTLPLGAALLALYLILLARNDLDSRVPGGWKTAAAVVVLCLAGYLGAVLWRSRPAPAAIRPWLVGHAAPLTLLALTLLGAVLRVVGIGFGLPYLDHPDEPAVADRAIGILQTGDLNPHYFIYPDLYTYLEAVVFVLRFLALVSSGALERLDQIQPADFYLWGRLLTAALGIATIPLVYLAGRRLYGTTVGLIAAGFLAFNNLHSANSQFITVDVPVTFFTALALVTIVYLLPAPAWESSAPAPLAGLGRYLAAGAAMGLAVGTKYQSGLILLPFLLAHGFAVAAAGPHDRVARFFGGRLWLALAVLAGTFLLTTPFALLDLSHFLSDVASAIAHYRFGHLGFEGDNNWRVYLPQLFAQDPVQTLLALAGFVIAFLRHRRADVVLVAFPAALYFTMSGYRVIFLHNLLPLLPFTMILGALALVLAWRAIAAAVNTRWMGIVRRPGLLTGALLIVAVLVAVWPGVAVAARHDYLYAQPDTRVRAAAWLDAHTSPGAKVWMETPLHLTADRYLTANGKHVTEHPLAWYVANRFDYLVVTADGYKSVFDNPASDPTLHDDYVQFFQENAARRVADFEPNKENSPGPAIQIFRTGYTPPDSPADVHAEHPLAAVFAEGGTDGGQIQLLGADLPASVAAGSPLPLVLYWADTRPVHADYTVFVHLLNAAGATATQRDTGPRNGTDPTSTWHAGEIVVDEADLNLPANLAPGAYTLSLGLYLQSTGAALQVSNAPGNCPVCVVLGPIQVTAPAK